MRFDDFKPYVRVAERRAKAQREIKKLRKKGFNIQPVFPEGNKITTTFWGNGWSEHIETLSDFESRLPRGRSYVRNGLVCHLGIERGGVTAIVSGSDLYNINISIKELSSTRWNNIKKKCAGQISSIVDLLSGNLSEDIMTHVCDGAQGLFPQPEEIEFSCDCPDWADMCKHIAASLYGIGTRLDSHPEQLFRLRGVNHEELINVSDVVMAITQSKSTRRRIAGSAVSDIFNIDMTQPTPTKKPTEKRFVKPAEKKQSTSFPRTISGAGIKKKRKQLRATQKEFAAMISVSASMISTWERKGRKKLSLKTMTTERLKEIW